MPYLKKRPTNQYSAFCVDEVIKENNPVRLYRLVSDKYVSSNSEKLCIKTENHTGRPEYHPSDMLCLFLYGYINRISSSRLLEKECHRNIEVQWMMGHLTPDHWTINNFRTNNRDLIRGLVKQFRKFMKEQKLIDGNMVMVDGTKLKANNCRDMLKATELRDMVQRSEEGISKYLDELDQLDKLEEEKERFQEMQEERERLTKELEELKEKTEEQQRLYNKAKEERVKYLGTTDKDSRLMLSRNGKIPGFNAQMAVDSKNHLIVGNSVTNDAVDKHQLKRVVEELIAEGMPIETVVADKGYSTLDEIQQIEEETSVECVVGIIKTPRGDEEDFIYDAQTDEYVCQMGKRLTLLQKGNKSRGGNPSVYLGRECEGCPMREGCTKSERGRRVDRRENQEWREAYKERMKQEENKNLLARRKGVIEHVFGTIKLYMGAVPLLLRGIEGVGIEVDLYVQAYNFKRVLNLFEFSDLMSRVAEFNWKMA